MNGHVIDILGAYLDGELSIARRQKVEQHLSECPVCRLELESLRNLSKMLQAAPVPEFVPVEKFASNLALQLPRQQKAARVVSKSSAIWWIIPLVLLAIWLVLQILGRMNGLVTLVNTGEVLVGAAPAAPVETSHSIWFVTVMDLFGQFFGSSQQAVLTAVDQISEFAANALGQLIWQAAIGLAYLGWLVIWWQRRGPRARNTTATQSH